MKTDSRVDQYIAKAPPFAQPILTEVRARVRKACPAVEETIKWNVPLFLLEGEFLASMAAFKKHLKVVVWTDGKGDFVDVTSSAELPPAKAFTQQLQAAAKLIGGATPKTVVAKKAVAKKTVAKKTVAKKTVAKKRVPKKRG